VNFSKSQYVPTCAAGEEGMIAFSPRLVTVGFTTIIVEEVAGRRYASRISLNLAIDNVIE
jgi:hypothetical protein